MVRIGMTCVKEDISRTPIIMEHAGKEGVTIVLPCVGNIITSTGKGMLYSVVA